MQILNSSAQLAHEQKRQWCKIAEIIHTPLVLLLICLSEVKRTEANKEMRSFTALIRCSGVRHLLSGTLSGFGKRSIATHLTTFIVLEERKKNQLRD